MTYRRKKAGCKDFDDLFARQLKLFAKYDVDIAIATMNRSMDNGWTGLFPEKEAAQESAKRGGAGRKPERDLSRLIE